MNAFYHIHTYDDMTEGYICSKCGKVGAMPVIVPNISAAICQYFTEKLTKHLPQTTKQSTTIYLCKNCEEFILPPLNDELDVLGKNCACPVCEQPFGNSIRHIANHAKRCDENQATIITTWETPVAKGKHYYKLVNAEPKYVNIIASALAFHQKEFLVSPQIDDISGVKELKAIFGN